MKLFRYILLLITTTPLVLASVLIKDVKAQSNQVGFTVGHSNHTSYWYRRAQQGNPQSYPINNTTNITIGGFYERTGLFDLGPVRSDIKIEAFLALGSTTKEDWLPLNETVSKGDIGYGAAAILKFGYPVEISSEIDIVPFLGLGPGVVAVNANGEASLDTQFATGYGYDDGFLDGVFGLLLDIGVSVPLERIVITPEVRFLLSGDSFGDWFYITSPDGAEWTMFGVNIGFKL